MANDQTHEFKGVSAMPFAPRYDNYIGGKWMAPKAGRYFTNATPITGADVCEIARSDAADIEAALDAAHAAADRWGRTSVQERAAVLLKIADRMEQNIELLASAETWDNGKPIRETMAADLPLAIDHFRYFAGCLRAQEGTLSQIDDDTVAYYPEAFSAAGRDLLEALYPDAVLASRADAEVLGLNFVSDGRHVVLSRDAVALAEQLRDTGYEPVPVDLSELLKAGGSVKCCTLELRS